MFNVMSIVFIIISIVGVIGDPTITIDPSSNIGGKLGKLNGNVNININIPIRPNLDFVGGIQRVGPIYGPGHHSKYMGGIRLKF